MRGIFIFATGLLVGTVAIAETQEKAGLHYTKNDSQEVRVAKAKELVHAAVEYYQKNGKEKALEAFNDRQGSFCYHYPNGYAGIITWSPDGICLSHCKFPKLVGKDITTWHVPSGDGQNLKILNEIKKSPSGVFITGLTGNLNPTTGKPSKVEVYGEKVGDLVILTGIFGDEPLDPGLVAREDVSKLHEPGKVHPQN